MLKKTIPFFIITAAVLLIISGLTLFTKAAPQPANTSEQLQAQKQLIILYIESADLVNAQAEFDNLIADFGNTEEIVPAVYDIAEAYRNNSKFEESLQAYADVVNNWPESSSAVWAQRGLAISNIALGRTQQAQVELEKLQTNYSTDPNIAESVFNVADAYYWFKRYDEADSLYRYVLQSYPDSNFAMWSQMGLAILNIADGNEIAAQDATNTLVDDFGDNEKLPEALFYIAGRYAWDKKYSEAQDIYYYIIDQFSESEWAQNSEFESVKVDIYLLIDANDEPNAISAIDDFIVTYADKPELPSIIYDFAARYDQPNASRRPKLIKTIYQQLMEYFPESVQARRAKLNVSRLNINQLIESGNDAGILDDIDTLIADFNNHPDLPMAVSLIAQSYYKKGFRLQNEGLDDQSADNYRKTITIREIVIQQFPSSDLTTRAYYLSAVLYSQHLQQYQKAIEYFQKVVDNWPDYQFAWHAQYFIGYYYEKLRNSGAIAESEANPKIEQAYQAVVEKYPDSRPAPHVAIKLGRLNFEKEQWSQAVKYFEFFLEKFPEQFRRVVVPLGQAYEKMGELEKTKELYRAFIDSADPSDSRIKTVKTLLEQL